jgi:hypothetical protein
MNQEINYMSEKIKILVCVHKECELPKDDIYLPIQVGKALSDIDLGIQGDDTGDNISEKNKSFCELTALYWAWKNIKMIYPDIEYIGLCHYRRYLALDKWKTGRDGICTTEIPDMKDYKDILSLYLRKYQIFFAKRKIYSYNLRIDYSFCHYSEDYRIIKEIVHELYPEYDTAFTTFFEHNNKISHYNIFVSSYSFFTEYCGWLFTILFEAERRINISNYNEYQKRVFAFFAERLLNVYVFYHKQKILYKPIFWINSIKKNGFFIDFFRSAIYEYLFLSWRFWKKLILFAKGHKA